MPEPQKKFANKVMTVKEASTFLKLPLSTLYDLTKKGKIPATKCGKHWRYLEEDILAFLHGARPQPQALPSTPKEQRQFQRLNCDLEGILHPELKSSAATLRGRVKNISEGGILFSISEKLPAMTMGDPVSISLALESRLIQCQGRIVHIRVNGSAALGIKFRMLSGKDQEVIRGYVG